jgi:hypothetical protein
LSFCAIALGAAIISFSSLSLWTFALAVAAIVCGVVGLGMLRWLTTLRKPWVIAGLSAGVIGIVLGALRAIGSATHLTMP